MGLLKRWAHGVLRPCGNPHSARKCRLLLHPCTGSPRSGLPPRTHIQDGQPCTGPTSGCPEGPFRPNPHLPGTVILPCCSLGRVSPEARRQGSQQPRNRPRGSRDGRQPSAPAVATDTARGEAVPGLLTAPSTAVSRWQGSAHGGRRAEPPVPSGAQYARQRNGISRQSGPWRALVGPEMRCFMDAHLPLGRAGRLSPRTAFYRPKWNWQPRENVRWKNPRR